jgi:hypothetical protein
LVFLSPQQLRALTSLEGKSKDVESFVIERAPTAGDIQITVWTLDGRHITFHVSQDGKTKKAETWIY